MKLELFEQLLGDQKIVLADVGAAGGIDRCWKKLSPFLQVLTFEPDERSSLSSETTSSGSRRPQIINFNSALGEQEKESDFYLTAFPPASSIFQPDTDFISSFPNVADHVILKKIRLKLRTLDSVLQEAALPVVDFIKLDTQGCDLSILKGGEKHLQSSIFGIQIEVEFNATYHERPSFGEIDEYLHRHGFALFNLRREFWKRAQKTAPRQTKGQLIWADALYFRTIPSLFALCAQAPDPRGMLIKACLLSVFHGYHDYAMEIVTKAQQNNLLSQDDSQRLEKAIRKSLPRRLSLPLRLHQTLLGKAHRFFAHLIWEFYQRIRPHWHEFVISDLE